MKTLLYLLLFTFFLFPCRCAADGLSTPFIDVQLEGVPLGASFPVTSSAGEGLLLHNLGDTAVQIRVEVLQPDRKELRGRAQPIPDVQWVKVVPDAFELPARGEKRCLLTLSVPAGKKYSRQYYQAMIWSRSLPRAGQGMSFNAGLLSRLRFKTR